MWNPNRVNHQYVLLLQNYVLQLVFLLLQTRMVLHPIYQYQLEGCYDTLVYQLQLKICYNTLFTNANWKEATTPWFISYN